MWRSAERMGVTGWERKAGVVPQKHPEFKGVPIGP